MEKIWTAYSSEADITFIMEEATGSLNVNGWYWGEPDDECTAFYHGRNHCAWDMSEKTDSLGDVLKRLGTIVEESTMESYDKAYWDTDTCTIVKVEELMHQYMYDEGDIWKNKSFAEYLEKDLLLDGDLITLQDAYDNYEWEMGYTIDAWKNQCEFAGCDPTSIQGMRMYVADGYADKVDMYAEIQHDIAKAMEE